MKCFSKYREQIKIFKSYTIANGTRKDFALSNAIVS